MILVHNNHVELSRNLLASIPDGVTSIDCTNGIPTEDESLSILQNISAYPSVIIDVPAYSVKQTAYDENSNITGVTTTTVPAHQELLRSPLSWDAVNQYVAFVTERATESPAS